MKISIDLLPESRKVLMAKKRKFKNIIKQEILFIVPLVVFIFMLIGINLILKVQNDTIVLLQGISGNENSYKDLKSYEDQTKAINEKVSYIEKFQDNHIRWSVIIDELVSNFPEGMVLGELSTSNYVVSLSGKAVERETLIKFKDIIENSKCFENVNVPLSNLVVKSDIDFQMNFTVKKECLIAKKNE